MNVLITKPCDQDRYWNWLRDKNKCDWDRAQTLGPEMTGTETGLGQEMFSVYALNNPRGWQTFKFEF